MKKFGFFLCFSLFPFVVLGAEFSSRLIAAAEPLSKADIRLANKYDRAESI